MVSLDAPERAFRRRLPGAPIRYVGFSTSPEWLRVAHASASSCRSPILAASHLDIHRWRPNRHAVWLAERLLETYIYDAGLHSLHVESRALELIAHIFDGFGRPLLVRKSIIRVRRVRDLLEDAPEAIRSMQDITQFAGVNPTTLQEEFRIVYGVTLFGYLRDVRLRRAAAALQDGAAIAQAAHMAGYASSANFATAFKRRFGVSPKVLKKQL